MRIDINCDMGESFGSYTLGDDAAVIRSITSANIACGYHAGDPLVMGATIRLALDHGVAVGAHPGFPDLMGFGRRALETFPGEVKHYLLYQLGALFGLARSHGATLQHVKLHGALYNMGAVNERLAREVCEAVLAFDARLILVTQPESVLARLAAQEGIAVAREFFPDRAYTDSGALAPRSMPGAVLHDPQEVRERVLRLVQEKKVQTITGQDIPMEADTLCVHGDTPGAWQLAAAIRQALESSGIQVVPMHRFVGSKPR
ncbi:MAG: LamB/YcsF family protein [Desulfosoma sp.]|uniref:LamB/YcsF family protein n=1 Tax=Desulfosoma sp. TaxID=2603217 RepID=UPI004049CFA3